MKRKFSLVMSAANDFKHHCSYDQAALAEDIQTPETASTETIVAEAARPVEPPTM